MPITIRNYETNSAGDEVAAFCEDEWRLREQLTELQDWVGTHASKLPMGDYVVDVGFSQRQDAAGGGSILHSDTLAIMVSKGMSLELSEYPIFE